MPTLPGPYDFSLETLSHVSVYATRCEELGAKYPKIFHDPILTHLANAANQHTAAWEEWGGGERDPEDVLLSLAKADYHSRMAAELIRERMKKDV